MLTWHRKHERKIWHWNEQIYFSYGIYFLYTQTTTYRILNNTTWWLIGNISGYSINLNDRDLSSNTYSTLVMNRTLVRFYWKRKILFSYHLKTDYIFWPVSKLLFMCSNIMQFMIDKIIRWDYKLLVCRVNITAKDTQGKPS